MIKTDNQHPILEALHKDPVEFIPTGSRFLETHTDYSDYDFYVAMKPYTEESNFLRKRLDALGFKPVLDGGYCIDDSLNVVLRWTPPAGANLRSVDVLIGPPDVIAQRMAVFNTLRTMNRGDVQRFCKALKSNADAWQVLFELCKKTLDGKNT